jgi:MFS superfamily sulfate permease-like transporter
MYYANVQQLSDEVNDLVKSAQPRLRWFCIDASAVDDVDYSAAESLRSLFAMLKERQIHLVMTQVMEDLGERSRYHLVQLLGSDSFYGTLEEVARAYRQQTPRGAWR